MAKLVLSLIFGFAFLFSSNELFALELQYSFNLAERPVKGWILVFDQDKSYQIDALVTRSNGGYSVSGGVSDLTDLTLISFGVELSSGEIKTSPIRKVTDLKSSDDADWRNTVNAQSNSLQSEIQQLEIKLAKVTALKRDQAGLSDVDRIYEQLSQVEHEIDRLKVAQTDLATTK